MRPNGAGPRRSGWKMRQVLSRRSRGGCPSWERMLCTDVRERPISGETSSRATLTNLRGKDFAVAFFTWP